MTDTLPWRKLEPFGVELDYNLSQPLTLSAA